MTFSGLCFTPVCVFNKGVHVHEHVNVYVNVGGTVVVDVHVHVDVTVDGFWGMWCDQAPWPPIGGHDDF